MSDSESIDDLVRRLQEDNSQPVPPFDTSAGWMLRPIMDKVGLHTIPQEYIDAVRRYRGLNKLPALYQRPQPGKNQDAARLHKCGQFTKIPPEDRLVDVEEGCFKHLEKAKLLRFPRTDLTSSVSDMYRAVAEELAERHRDPDFHLEASRDKWIEEFNRIDRTLDDLNAHIAKHQKEEHRNIMGNSRLASVGAIVESYSPEGAASEQWADRLLLLDLLEGMTQAGDPERDGYSVRNTGIFRPVATNAQYSVGDLHAGKAIPLETVWTGAEWQQRRKKEALPSTQEWVSSLDRQTSRDAELAMSRAGIKPEEASKAMRDATIGSKRAIPDLLDRVQDERARKNLERLLKCEELSREEIVKGTMQKPKTVQGFRTWEEKMAAEARPCRRNCIQRGFKDDGVTPKLRNCDDFRLQGGNGACTIPEKTDVPSWLWCALMAIIFCMAFARRNLPTPVLTTGLDDMRAAYRTVPALMWPYITCLVMWYSFLLAKTVVQGCAGHLFGGKPSNNNFSRVPRVACVAVAQKFLCATVHYVDDFMNTDVHTGGQSAHRALTAVLKAMGWDTEESKWKQHDLTNIALGARTDLTRIPTERTAEVGPDESKAELIIKLARAMKQRGECSKDEAETIVGKTRWLTGQLRSRAGTATTQPFAHRARGGDGKEWNEEMDGSLEFLETVLDPEFRKPVEVNLDKMSQDEEPCIILYSDAMYEEVKTTLPDGRTHTVRNMPVAVYAYDQANGQHYSAHLASIPDEFYVNFPTLDNYVTRGEIVAQLAAFYSKPELFAGRRVISFIDNATALSNLVNGYASKADMAKFVNMFHVAILALDIEWYGEWVPSKANVADIMTRPSRFHELRAGLGVSDDYFNEFSELKLPPMEADLKTLWRAMQDSLKRVRGEAA